MGREKRTQRPEKQTEVPESWTTRALVTGERPEWLSGPREKHSGPSVHGSGRREKRARGQE